MLHSLMPLRGGNTNDKRNIDGYCMYMGDCLISWSSSKKKVISPCSWESEYSALTSIIAKLMWMKSLLQELQVYSLKMLFIVTMQAYSTLLRILLCMHAPNMWKLIFILSESKSWKHTSRQSMLLPKPNCIYTYQVSHSFSISHLKK